MTPALSVTSRTLCVVRNSTSGTGQPLPFSTTSIRHGAKRVIPSVGLPALRFASAPPIASPSPAGPSTSLVAVANHRRLSCIFVCELFPASGKADALHPSVKINGVLAHPHPSRIVEGVGVAHDGGFRSAPKELLYNDCGLIRVNCGPLWLRIGSVVEPKIPLVTRLLDREELVVQRALEEQVRFLRGE